MFGQRFLATVTLAFAFIAAVAPRTWAEDNGDAFDCRSIGPNVLEPLGDREGHGIRVIEISCTGTVGPPAGGVLSATLIWETDKTEIRLLSAGGVIRKPGATSAYSLSDGKSELVLKDGKIIGVDASGHGTYTLAIGSAAARAGKAFSFTSHTTAPGQFVIEATGE